MMKEEERQTTMERLRRTGLLANLKTGLWGLCGIALLCLACCLIFPASFLLTMGTPTGKMIGILCILISISLIGAGIVVILHSTCRSGGKQGRVIATAQEQQLMLNNAIPQPPGGLAPLPNDYTVISNIPHQQYPPATFPPPPDYDLPTDPPPAYQTLDKDQGSQYQGATGPHNGLYGSFQPSPVGPVPSAIPDVPNPDVGPERSTPSAVPPGSNVTSPLKVDV